MSDGFGERYTVAESTTDLVIWVYTNKIVLVTIYLDKERVYDTSKYAERLIYETYCNCNCK